MNISQTNNLQFGNKTAVRKLTTFRIPGKNNTTVVTDIVETGRDKLTQLEYRVMKRGKVLEKESFQNKSGFKDERILKICEKVQTKLKEGYDFLQELISAQFGKKNLTL